MTSIQNIISLKEFNAYITLIKMDKMGSHMGDIMKEKFNKNCGSKFVNKIQDKCEDKFIEMVDVINEVFNQDKKVKFLNIIPLGYVANCHLNVSKFVYLINQMRGETAFEVVKGYNITSCKCITMLSTEVHSVVREIKTGLMIDFTEDFNDNMESKFFLEVEWLTKYYTSLALKHNSRKLDTIYLMRKHTCPDGERWQTSSGTRSMAHNKKELIDLLNEAKELELEEFDVNKHLKRSWIDVIDNRDRWIDLYDLDDTLYNLMTHDNESFYEGKMKILYKAKKIKAEENMSKEETLNTFLFKPTDNKSKKKTKKTKKKGRK